MRVLKQFGMLSVALLIVMSYASVNKAQEKTADKADSKADSKENKAEAKKDEANKKAANIKDVKSPPFISYRDLMPPIESFRYWVDTVILNEKDFRKLLVDEYLGFHARDDDRVANAETYVKSLEANGGLRRERIRRLEMSFDFERYLARLKKEDPQDFANLTPEKQRQRIAERLEQKKKIISTQLGNEVRRKWALREITALKECGVPDLVKRKAEVLMKVRNLVKYPIGTKGKIEYDSYVIYMTLPEKSLMWRWHQSKLLPFKDKNGKLITDPCDVGEDSEPKKIVAKNDDMEDVRKKILEQQKKLAELKDNDRKRDEERANVERDLRALEKRKAELQRARSPYGTPSATWTTLKKAYQNNKWEVFLASHTKAVREKATKDPQAKKTFEKASKQLNLRQFFGNPTITYDREDPTTKATLKIVVSVASVNSKAAGAKDGNAKRSDVDESKAKRSHLTLRLRKEKGKWLVDNGL